MKAGTMGLEPELRISSKWVLGVLLAIALVVLLVGDDIPDLGRRSQVSLLGVLLCLLISIGWILDSWMPQAGHIAAVVLVIALALSLRYWLGIAGTLAFLSIATGLAAAMLGLTAAAIVTLCQSILVLLMAGSASQPVDRTELVVALVALWGSLGVMLAAYQPLYQLQEWLSQYLDRAQTLLEDSLDRKVELAQALEDLRNANRQLALANERSALLRAIAEEAQESKASFVAQVSHEFRTPLNMIIGLVGIMVEDPSIYVEELPPEIWEDLGIVHRNCQHLLSMINDVLDLSQAEAGRLVLHREPTDLRAIVDEAVEVVRPMIERKHLALQVCVAENLPRIYCDPTRIRQVILNLVSNAARFTMQGGIGIEVIRDKTDAMVTVTDTGPGIPQGEVSKVFEPFYLAKDAHPQDGRGSGLGLSISRQFVHLHGGRMWLESQVGSGTSFYFALPVSPQAGPAASPHQWIKEDWVWRERAFNTSRSYSREQLLRPRIVVLDETGELYPQLAHCANEVEVLGISEMAQIEQELENCPADVLILNTAREDDLLAHVRKMGALEQSTPVVGCSIPRLVSRAEQLGALCHLTKPVTRADLERVIQMVDRPVRRILLVDDEPEVLQLWTRMLHIYDRSLEVITVGDGQRALELMERVRPDLVVLDVVMPRMDGWQMLAQMAEKDETRGTPVIVVSAQDSHPDPPLASFLVASYGKGLSIPSLLRCSLNLASVLPGTGRGPDPMRP